ncbi:hypothetical protein GBA63_08395 [Rubrobacter tropicus]|uniref:Uncharacterized protein n=1 Tax=Rubrobacter tropicus TaxID=2653851 RepID=A0A6G8Q861_9ACTN|nr:hypothetical protein [Rubrobacter tropicus]QIN82661.1 hypothetical protein GBA63_08395 [Rubrobacter tropicus]
MPDLICAARRTGDQESRTEEYELRFSAGEAPPQILHVKYQAARAYEINAALDAATEASRATISENHPGLPQPTDEALAQLFWRTIQAAKYEGGQTKVSTLEI